VIICNKIKVVAETFFIASHVVDYTPQNPMARRQSKKKDSPMAVDGSNEEVYGCTPGSCQGFITAQLLFTSYTSLMSSYA